MLLPDRIFDLFLFLVLSIVAEVLGTIGGFGSSLFFVSLLQLFMAFSSVLALTGLLHIFSNTTKIILFWKAIDWKLTAWLGIPSTLLAIVGAYLTAFIDFNHMKVVLGIFLIVLSVVLLIKPDFSISPNQKNATIGGAIAGLWLVLLEPVAPFEG
jgi:uncharacterized membrane protein YfcA